jgi:hypothetical protein
MGLEVRDILALVFSPCPHVALAFDAETFNLILHDN